MALLAAAERAGARTVVATPHVSPRYPNDPDTIAAGVAEVRAAARAAGLTVGLLPGAEVALEPALELPDETLRRLTLGGSSCLLLESPLTPAVGPSFERCVADLQARGYRILLAHPERAPALLDRPQRLRALVDGGALCSITAAALTGGFGQGPRWYALELLRDGLVHSVDSDAHHAERRPPGLRDGLLAAAEVLPDVAARAGWYMTRAPEALLSDRPLPPYAPASTTS